MTIKDLRNDLEGIRASAEAGDLAQVVRTADHALHTLEADRLLTTTEAAELLGIRSVNTLKLLVRQNGLRYETHGNRMMVPLAELERIQDSSMVRGIRASDRAHDATESLGAPDGLTGEQLADLRAGRPGRLPWEVDEPR